MSLKYSRLVQEDLNVGTGPAWVTAPGRGKLRSTQVGIHTVARGQKSYSGTWAPGAIAAGASTSTTVTVPNATAGDIVMASHTEVEDDLSITGHVSASDTVTVEIYNPTSASITVASGTVSVAVFEMITVSTCSSPIIVIENTYGVNMQGVPYSESGTATISVADLDDGTTPTPAWWQLYVVSQGSGTSPVGGDFSEGADAASVSITLTCVDFAVDTIWLFTVTAWGENPNINDESDCFTEDICVVTITDTADVCTPGV